MPTWTLYQFEDIDIKTYLDQEAKDGKQWYARLNSNNPTDLCRVAEWEASAIGALFIDLAKGSISEGEASLWMGNTHIQAYNNFSGLGAWSAYHEASKQKVTYHELETAIGKLIQRLAE